MKDFVKVCGILLLALLATLFGYPFLHELGHWVAAVMCGARVENFRLFSVPFVLCNVYGIHEASKVIIGVSGILLPFFVSFLIKGKSFWVWLFSFCLKIVSTVAFCFSCMAIMCYKFDIVWQGEDIVTILRSTSTSSSLWLLLMLAFLCFNIFIVYKNKPLERIGHFFET